MKQYMAACGANISQAHFYRNTAKSLMNGLLAKDKTLNDAGKALKLYLAREALTAALMATAEGQALLLDTAAQSVIQELLAHVEVEIKATEGIGTPDVFAAKVDELTSV